MNDKEEVHEGVHEGYKRPNKSSYTHKIAGQTRQYGAETVTAWECAKGCPVAGLDAQVTGGASRFFKRVGGAAKTSTDG